MRDAYSIQDVEVVRSADLAGFESYLNTLHRHRLGNVFDITLTAPEQRQAHDLLRSYFHPLPPGVSSARRANTLFAFHGCKASVVTSIVTSGFGNLSLLDPGYFGKGYYLTPNAEYAAMYACGDIAGVVPEADKATGFFPVLMCALAVGTCYPVTRVVDYPHSDPTLAASGHSKLYDRPLHSKCDAHFAPVHESKGFQCVDAELAQFSELVLNQYQAALPLAILWIKKK